MNWLRLRRRILRAKSSSKTKELAPEFSGFCLLSVAVLMLYCLLRPHHCGVAGALLARSLLRGFGLGAYFVTVLVAYRGIRLLLHREQRRPWRYVTVDLLLLASACATISSFGRIFWDRNFGGYVGKMATETLTGLFGRWGALLVSFAVMVALFLWRSNQRPRNIVVWVWDRLRGDWTEWRQALAIERERSRPSTRRKDTSALAAEDTSMEKPIVRLKEPAGAARETRPVVASSRAAPSKMPLEESELEETPLFVKPSLELLHAPDRSPRLAREEDLLASSQHLEKTLADFGVEGKVVEIHPGPIITRFDFTPAPGIKVQAVANLSNDIALAMKAMSVRVLAPIPGKSAVGIELPSPHRALVRLREVLESEAFQNHPSKLAVGLGLDAEGHPYVSDLGTMPHLLIAGSTGSGKSVCIHAVIMSLIFRATPQEVKLMLIDPKRLELPLYNGIPYLYDPNQNPDNVRVITDPKEAAKALEGMVKVMDHRFKKFASVMARDIDHYNDKMREEGQPQEPYVVIVIDELADLMAVSPKEVEGTIQRLTQMARAVGIHMVLATQRPSVDVITGVIKANLPARLAFRVASQTDSRVILDGSGAESLLGEGDLLFLPPGAPKPWRLQCGLVTIQEAEAVADYVRAQGKPSYERVLAPIAGGTLATGEASEESELDDLQQALMLVLERRRVSQDLLKAHFGSSARATDLLSVLEVKGFISKPEGTNRWTIYYDRIDNYLNSLKQQTPVS
jgi:S-DNA-T family DNA segregation ATPase FtsK/SpoIIIE